MTGWQYYSTVLQSEVVLRNKKPFTFSIFTRVCTTRQAFALFCESLLQQFGPRRFIRTHRENAYLYNENKTFLIITLSLDWVEGEDELLLVIRYRPEAQHLIDAMREHWHNLEISEEVYRD